MKLKGSSLMEVLVAYSLLAIVFMISGSSWLSMKYHDHATSTWQTRLEMRDLFYLPVSEADTGSRKIERSQLQCIRNVIKIEGIGNRYRIELSCRKGERILKTRRRIINLNNYHE